MSNSKLLLAKISNGLLLEYLIITIILSTVIFLLDHPIKYVLFIFGVSLTWLLFLTVSRYDYTFKLSLPISDKIVDYFFIVCSAAVLAFNIFANHIMNISFILSIIVSFFLPGWVLLRLLKIDRIQGTNFGLFVLSFSISIGLTSLVYMFALPFKSSTAAIILSIIYVGISVLPLIKDRFYNGGERRQFYSSNHRSEHNLFDILLLIWLILFFIFVISNLYPQMAYLPGIDIIRHFSYTKGLILAPDTYVSQLYPWFHFTWAVVNELSASPPMWLFQSFIAYLSGMLIFSFYIMAKEYLSDIDTRAPILATVFFVVFSGFGWIYFAQHVLNMPNPSQHWYLLHQSALQSHLDITYGEGSWLWLWFRPITVGFTIFFVLLWLMRREGLTKLNYIIISSLLILTLNQVHFSELIIFVTLLFILALLFPTIKLRLKETAISILISLASTALLIPAYQNLLSSEYLLASNQYLFVLAALAGLVFILVKYPRRPRISFRMNLTVLTSIALFVYFILLSYWFLHIDNLILDLSEISSVPLEYYPILLGIAGIFAIPCFILLAKKKYRSNPIVIFVILFVLIVIFGRTVTYINANIENTNYWERRLIPFAFVSVSILSSIAILKVIEQLKQHQQLERHFRSLKNILTVTFLSFLVVGGILSTFLSVEYWIINTSKYSLSDKEIDDNHLNSIDPNSTLLTLSDRSHNIAEFASVDYLVGYYKYQLWPSESPELPLNILYSLNNPVIIYLSERDLKQITSYIYGNSYIASNLLRMASDTKKSFGNGTTIQTPRLAPTSSSSDTVLVIPEGEAKFYYYAYDILSLGGYNYTSVLVSDINSISKARIVVAPSEQIALKVMDYKSKYNLQYEKLIVLNVDRYDQLVDVDNATFSPLIGEDKPSAGWITSGSGAGKIGVPKIIDNPNTNTNTSGKNSFRISVGEGEYGLWQISRQLSDKPLNLTNFEFVGFNWYGKGDGRWYSLQFTSGPDQFFWYRFQDSWSGWRQVILPMQMSDGRGHISGVTFDKTTAKQGASWAKIIRIDL